MPTVCRKWLSLALLMAFHLAAHGVAAETIRVRGGEHEGFTRLALDLPRSLAWRMVEHETRFDLVFEAPDLSFDLSAARSRLNADRIGAVEQGQRDGVLRVGLNCDCAVNAFLFGGTMLVVDVSERRSASPDEADERERADFLTTFWIDNAVLRANHATTPAMAPPADPPQEAGDDKKPKSAPRRRIPGAASASPTITPHATAEQPDTDAKEQRRPDALQDLVTTALQDVDGEGLQGVNLAIRNGADKPEPRDRLAAMAATRDETCLVEKDLDIADWAREGHFTTAIGRLRSELYGEFDRSRREIALELAKVYIFFGFGAEAMLVLEEFVDDAGHLVAIASLIETGTVPGQNMFADALSCDNEAALWSMLSHEAGAIGTEVDPSAVLTAFDRLPSTLRTHLAGALSERFRSLDMPQDAKEVLRLAARSGAAADPNAKLAGALIRDDENRAGEAYETLTELTEQNHETSPRAMIELISRKMREDGSIDYDTAQMARILQKEYSTNELSAELRFSTVVALTLSDAFSESLDALAGLRADVDGDAFRQAQDFLHDRMARKASDPVFLSAALALTPDTLNELVSETVFGIADRLVALGFPDSAVDLLGPAFRGHDMQAARRLRARAQIDLGNPDMAAAELSGLEGARADRLRAQLSESRRNFEQALALYRGLGDDDKVEALEELLAGSPANPEIGQPSRIDATGPSNDPAPLASSRRRVDASADTRREIEALLAAAPPE
ncbi:MAG: hypothetical protein HLUCCO07_08425 [Rhodobacteraceae bacterium HLUCCO07]|nr:MAG: hypothetical protein HLUCCO07_08425 [Rhodobacteraceae bacterium HLUCCO07]